MAFLLALCTPLVASAQSQQEAQSNNAPIPTLKTRLRLVVVDVVVSNNNGEPVPGLKKEDFEVLEDGKYRHIQVKLASGKETLSYRRGYYADDLATAQASAQKQSADPLMQLMGRNLPDYSQILFKILVKPSTPQPAADAPHVGSNSDMTGPFTVMGLTWPLQSTT